MNEQSQHVKQIIASRVLGGSGSIVPEKFGNLWRESHKIAGQIGAELTRHDADFQQVREKATALVDLAERMRVADAELRAQTPNGKRPRAYTRPEIDFAPEIEESLLLALSCVHLGDTAENMNALYRHTGDAYSLSFDAWNEFQRTRVR